MAAKIYGPRKRRTRQHVIADLSVHHVEGFILEEGHIAERIFHDYGYDLVMATFDSRGFVEPDLVYFQIKASENLRPVDGSYVYDLDVRDYHLWLGEQMPVILIIYDVDRRQSYWVSVKEYFRADEARRPRRGAKWIRIRIPAHQQVSRQAIVEFRHLKNLASGFRG